MRHAIAEKDSLPGTVNSTFVLIDREFQPCFKEVSRAMVIFHFSGGGAKVICHPLGQGYLPV
jgi:hypothetical protein